MLYDVTYTVSQGSTRLGEAALNPFLCLKQIQGEAALNPFLCLKPIQPSSVPLQPPCTHQVIIMGSVLPILGLANKDV